MVSTKDNVWLPHRTMCGFHTGQCVVSKQDNVSCPNKTMCASQAGQCMLPKQEKSKDGSDFDDFLTKTIGAPSKKIDHAETSGVNKPAGAMEAGGVNKSAGRSQ